MNNHPDNSKLDNAYSEVKHEAIDWSVLDALKVFHKPGKPDIARRLMTVYSTTAPVLMENIASAVAALDGQALMNAAHSLKSSSLCIGVNELGKICSELEQLGRNNALADAPALLRRAENEFAAAYSAILEAVQKLE